MGNNRIDYADFPADAPYVSAMDVRQAYRQGLQDGKPVKVTDMDPRQLINEVMNGAPSTYKDSIVIRDLVTQAIHKVVEPLKTEGEA